MEGDDESVVAANDKTNFDFNGGPPIIRLSKRVMKYLVGKGHIEPDWKKRLHTHLDFSNEELFKLASFQPVDFDWSGKPNQEAAVDTKDAKKIKGAVPAEDETLTMPVWKLHTLNVENNELTDADFDLSLANTKTITGMMFGNLKCLKMRNNKLNYPVLLLPRLKELHLSHNNLIRVPPLAGMPAIETLNISHNRIETLQGELFKDAKELRTIDVSSNVIDIAPSDLDKTLVFLGGLLYLSNLQLKDNPFCQFFGEYQMLVVRRCPNLLRMDDLPFTGDDEKAQVKADMLEEAKHYFGHEFKDVKLPPGPDGDERPLPALVTSVSEVPDGVLTEFLQSQLKVTVDGLDEKERMDQAKKFFSKERMEAIDKLVSERKGPVSSSKGETAQESAAARKLHAMQMPKITDIIKELDEAVADPVGAQTSITLVFNLASKCSGGNSDMYVTMFDQIGIHGPTKTKKDVEKMRQESSETFVQQMMILVERHPGLRGLLLRTFAKFCCVDKYQLGEKCLAALGTLSRSSASLADVLDVLKDMVIPQIIDKNMQDATCATIIRGLSRFDCPGLSDVLAPITNQICQLFQSSLRANRGGGNEDVAAANKAALVSLLKQSTEEKPNALMALKEGMPKEIGDTITKSDEFRDLTNWHLYLELVCILRQCIQHAADQVIADFKKAEKPIWVVLIENVQELFTTTCPDGTRQMQLPHAKKVGAVLGLVSEMMKDHEVLQSFGDQAPGKTPRDNIFLTVLLKAPGESATDPIVLTGSLDCLTSFLRDDQQRNAYLEFVVQELHLLKQIKIMEKIDEKNFREIYTFCEEHFRQAQQIELNGVAPAPLQDLKGVTNEYSHAVIIAIVEFINLFTELGAKPGLDEEDLCVLISGRMNEMQRERMLFKLLEVPSEAVQQSIVNCIGNVPFADLDDPEVVVLINMLDPGIIQNQESLVGSVIEQFGDFVTDDTEAADILRLKYAKKVLRQTYEILVTNCARKTYGNVEEEEQKSILSQQAVTLLFSASLRSLMRRHLRSDDMGVEFRSVLKNEELYHKTAMPDICIEMTWMGRNVEYLLGCLGLDKCLHPERKQSFRVIHRIADVIEGIEDSLARAPVVSAADRGAQEAKMWDAQRMRWNVGYIEDGVYEDRTSQQQTLVSFSGYERITHFLEHKPDKPDYVLPEEGAGEELDQDSEEGEKPKSGVSLQTLEMRKEVEEFRLTVMHHARRREAEVSAIAVADMAREDPEEIPLDVTIEEPGSAGKELMEECFMREGWRSDGFSEVGVSVFTRPTVDRWLKSSESFFVGPGSHYVARAFHLASFLRSVFCILTCPAVDRFRVETVAWLRQTTTQLRIITLIEVSGTYVDCHIAAKFLRVMSIALTLAPDQTTIKMEDKKEFVVSFGIMAMFANRCMEPITPLLSQLGFGYVLTEQQQTLCTECVRLYSVLVTSLPVARFCVPEFEEVQKECMEQVLTAYVSENTLRSVFLTLLYDMQVNIGSAHGRYINEKFVRSSLGRQGTRELCAVVLAFMINTAASARYRVLELFNQYEVFGKSQVRSSFLSDLMRTVHEFMDKDTTWKILNDKYGDNTEHILQITNVELPLSPLKFKRPDEPPRMLVMTNRRFVILARPTHTVHDEIETPVCGCFGRGGMQMEENYLDITRIIRGADSQMLVVFYLKKTNLGLTEILSEQFEVFICQKSNVRRGIQDAFVVLSSPGVEMQLPVQRDMLIHQAIKKRTASPTVCMTYAMRKIDGSERLSLFVLSETEVCEFEVSFDQWLAPFDREPDLDEEDDGLRVDDEFQNDGDALDSEASKKRAAALERARRIYQTAEQKYLTEDNGQELTEHTAWQDLDEVAVEAKYEERDDARSSTMQKFVAEQAKIEGVDASSIDRVELEKQAVRKAKSNVLKQKAHLPLSHLEQVDFDPGEVPLLRLTFQGNPKELVEIRFMDDVARERWRCGLAFVLNRSDTAAQWKRDWATEEGE